MISTMDFSIVYTFAGLFVGFLVGLTGVGGGSLMTPLLIFVFNVPTAIAIGTDLLFAAITKASGVWAHHRRSTIHWRVVGLLALGSIPSTLITVQFLKQLNSAGYHYEAILNLSLGIALVITSLVLFFRRQILDVAHHRIEALPDWSRKARHYVTILFGAILGILVTLSSIGAGALGAAVLTLLYPRMSSIRIVGTDIAHAVPLTAIAGFGHFNLGTVDTTLLFSLLLGSLPGIYLGSHFGAAISERITRPLLASAILLIGIKFIFA
jgi:hypothetical protein